jgi:peptidoglycan/xylan/chitin deacetylase (PgdA/CDA1 family)
MGTTAGESNQVVPVLLYHAVTTTPGRQIAPFTVSPDDFARHLDLVLEAGYRCTTFGDLLRREREGDLPERLAVITFDDGYADFAAEALPRLSARSLVSTVYLTTGWLEDGGRRTPGPTDRMLSMSQLPELVDQGVELGAHSHSHPHMDTLQRRALSDELSLPKAILEDALGRPVTTFAYPHGYSGARVRRATREAGYESGAGVRDALHRPGEDPFAISRLTVTATTTADELAGWLAGVDGKPPRTGEAWQTRAWRAYRRTRAVVTRRPVSAYT